MNSKLETFFEEISQKRVAVLGVGVTNAPLAELLISKGCDVTVCDRRSMDTLGEYGERLAALGAKFKLGDDYLQECSTICPSCANTADAESRSQARWRFSLSFVPRT